MAFLPFLAIASEGALLNFSLSCSCFASFMVTYPLSSSFSFACSYVGNTTVVISVDFTPTGVSGTSTTGTLQGTFWSNVDDSNSDISWTEVHEAA